MSVRKHPKIPNAFVIDWYPLGRNARRERQIIYDSNESEARLIEQSLRRRHNLGHQVNPLIREAIPDWLEWMTLHRAARTVESIGWALKHLLPHFGHLPVSQITELVVNQYKHKRKSAPRACNLELDYLKSLISWMVKRKLCEPLAIGIERLPYRRPLPKIPSPDDFARWMEAVEPDGAWDKAARTRRPGPKNALLWLMAGAGLRYREAACLTWGDVDRQQGIVTLRTTKGGRPRLAPLPHQAKAILDEIWKEEFSPDDLIAPNRDGKPFSHMKSLFRTAAERSGVAIKGPHTLRHICATYLLTATSDLQLVSTMLGHTQLRTTQLYAQVSIDRLKKAQQQVHDYARPTNPVNLPEAKDNSG